MPLPPDPTRRSLLTSAAWGLAVAATGGGGLILRAGAQPTPATDDTHGYGDYLQERGEDIDANIDETLAVPSAQPPADPAATEDNILGPYYRPGAPMRGKVTPPLEPGTVLLIRGRVWGLDTRRPLAGAVIDLWQADHQGRYDNDDPDHPPAENVFMNRCRLLTDDTGYYEYETIHPGAYQLGPETWRPPHVHYLVRARGYQRLITQLYFRGDEHQRADRFIKPSLVIDLARVRRGEAAFEVGTFDIVLAREG